MDEAIDEHVLPAAAQFAEATADLAEAAERDRLPEAVRQPLHEAFNSSPHISRLRIGPLEDKAGARHLLAAWGHHLIAIGAA